MIENLFAALPGPDAAEEFIELLGRRGLRIERIVSTGQASPPGHWYDQAEGEWVVVLAGEALRGSRPRCSRCAARPAYAP